MSAKRHKAPIKCDCGQAVAAGSVFCPFCKAAIKRKNARTIEREDRAYQKKVRGK
jgi:hypothetical protein